MNNRIFPQPVEQRLACVGVQQIECGDAQVAVTKVKLLNIAVVRELLHQPAQRSVTETGHVAANRANGFGKRTDLNSRHTGRSG